MDSPDPSFSGCLFSYPCLACLFAVTSLVGSWVVGKVSNFSVVAIYPPKMSWTNALVWWICMRAGKKKNEEETKSFKRGAKGRDSCSSEVCVVILVVDDEGYLVVLPAYL